MPWSALPVWAGHSRAGRGVERRTIRPELEVTQRRSEAEPLWKAGVFRAWRSTGFLDHFGRIAVVAG